MVLNCWTFAWNNCSFSWRVWSLYTVLYGVKKFFYCSLFLHKKLVRHPPLDWLIYYYHGRMNFKAGPTVLPGCIICLQEKQNVIFTRLLKPLPQITFILKKGFSDQSGGSLCLFCFDLKSSQLRLFFIHHVDFFSSKGWNGHISKKVLSWRFVWVMWYLKRCCAIINTLKCRVRFVGMVIWKKGTFLAERGLKLYSCNIS